MSTATPVPDSLHHHARRMGGRDPHEAHRAATPLELFFDLTFVTSFSFAASRYAHALAEGHYAVALIGFGFASFAICWAWVNFSWFASAYDTDDWVFRVATMGQMIGVLIFAVGLPPMFASLEHGGYLDNSVMVLGYVIMRVALVFQWLRAASQNPARRRACLTYAVAILIAQVGWVSLSLSHLTLGPTFAFVVVLVLIELAGPVIAERRDGGTPWHAHHIAERHGLFAIIALGEGVVGSVAALSMVVEEHGWSLDAGLAGLAGTGLTFAMWWVYFILPSARILHTRRDKAFGWGYTQMVIVTSIVATGPVFMSRPASSSTRLTSARLRRCSPLRFRSAYSSVPYTRSTAISWAGSIASTPGFCSRPRRWWRSPSLPRSPASIWQSVSSS